ncbi:unnamed protein product [Parajaminaea phylloscopi]
MLPAQRNKVDISSLSEEEQKLFRLYGKLPNRKDILGNKLKERKYFDSGDYALSKAGKAPQQSVGTAIPNPETIPHASTVGSPPGPAAPVGSPGAVSGSLGSPGVTATSNPISVPFQSSNGNGVHGQGGMLNNRQPPVSSFPTATGAAGSPSGKESSSLGREEVRADDTMEE